MIAIAFRENAASLKSFSGGAWTSQKNYDRTCNGLIPIISETN